LCFKDLDKLNETDITDENDPNIIVMAEGVKNSVGFDWHPTSNSFYFTDNARDSLSHWSYPDDELNYVKNGSELKNTSHFGFPWCHSLGSGNIDARTPDCSASWNSTTFVTETDCSSSTYKSALQPLGSHVVPLGMRFYNPRGDAYQYPDEYLNTIFIAERGSGATNSSGYRIAVAKLDDADESTVEYLDVFAYGWLKNDDSIQGRPVDVEVMYDGSLVVSDDYSDLIYRIVYTGDDKADVLFTDDDDATCDYSYAD